MSENLMKDYKREGLLRQQQLSFVP